MFHVEHFVNSEGSLSGYWTLQNKCPIYALLSRASGVPGKRSLLAGVRGARDLQLRGPQRTADSSRVLAFGYGRFGMTRWDITLQILVKLAP